METIETLADRVTRLEQLFEESTLAGARASDAERDEAHRFWNSLPFGAWLKISGPGFAVMALGFGVLWNGQQETTQRIIDLEQSTTDRILRMQEETTAKILALQEKTTDRILEMQGQILDLHRRDGER